MSSQQPRYRAVDNRVFRRESRNEETTIVFSARSRWWAQRICRALNASHSEGKP